MLTTAPAAGQELSAWIDAAASHALPPAGVTGAEPTTYGLLGGRLEASFGRASATAAGQLGSALSGADGRWLRGELALATGARLGPLGLRSALSAYGLHYLDPFAYDAAGLELRPRASVAAGAFVVTVRPTLGVGRWDTDLREGALWQGGGDLEVERSWDRWAGSVSAGALSVENGVFQGSVVRGSGILGYGAGRWSGAARIEAQRTPLETEVGGSVTVWAELGPGIQAQLHAGRPVRDLRFGSEGTMALSIGLALRPLARSTPPPPPVVHVGERQDQGRTVRFTLRAPHAEEVALSGDFTGWEPVLMERTGSGWRLELVLMPGLHHFGFLVDGTWSLPPDAPGLVDDGWGQRNASVVVEP